jgi:large subunit ribosomal protein L21
MYAVIETGGKQYRVEQGQTLDVERLGPPEGTVELRPVLVVDGDRVLATPAELQGASVTARILADTRGPKITGFTYKPKSNQRRRWGHRQDLSTVEIMAIEAVGTKAKEPAKATKKKATAATEPESGDAVEAVDPAEGS